MLLCLDVGNTHILGGVFAENKKPILRFRYATTLLGTADQFGIFLINVLNFHGFKQEEIKAIAWCSVVPNYDYTLKHSFALYFKQARCFMLGPGAKTGLNICCKNPREVGADRIANAMGAVAAFPRKSLIIVDMGTATTLCAIKKGQYYLGGAILPGLRLSMEALKNNTAKLMAVDIEAPVAYVGTTTHDSIQSGLYYGQLGALREIILGFKREVFRGDKKQAIIVIGTGGFARLYEKTDLFNYLIPDLVLYGLQTAFNYRATVKS